MLLTHAVASLPHQVAAEAGDLSQRALAQLRMAKSFARVLLAASIAAFVHTISAQTGKVVQSVLFHRHGDRSVSKI